MGIFMLLYYALKTMFYLFFVYVFVAMWSCVDMHTGTHSGQEGIRSPRAGVTDGCQ